MCEDIGHTSKWFCYYNMRYYLERVKDVDWFALQKSFSFSTIAASNERRYRAALLVRFYAEIDGECFIGASEDSLGKLLQKRYCKDGSAVIYRTIGSIWICGYNWGFYCYNCGLLLSDSLWRRKGANNGIARCLWYYDIMISSTLRHFIVQV